MRTVSRYLSLNLTKLSFVNVFGLLLGPPYDYSDRDLSIVAMRGSSAVLYHELMHFSITMVRFKHLDFL